MSGCVFGQRFKDKRDAPHYFHDTYATMMIRKFYAKLVMHAPMWTLKCRVFIVMRYQGSGFIFSILVNLVFPKYVFLSICTFIRVYFGCSGKLSQHSSFKCIHIFFQKLVMISDFFFKEKLKVISFQKHAGFLADNLLLFFFFFFLFFFFHEIFFYLNICIFL